MNPFIKLLSEAGEDENVISIKMTLYRVAKNSQIVETLINAAENGKKWLFWLNFEQGLTKKIILGGQGC